MNQEILLYAFEAHARGVQAFNKLVPGWQNLIDTERLDMHCVYGCVAGQIATATEGFDSIYDLMAEVDKNHESIDKDRFGVDWGHYGVDVPRISKVRVDSGQEYLDYIQDLWLIEILRFRRKGSQS